MIRVGIASIPQREGNLSQTIKAVISQTDSIVIGLNGYDKIPSFLKSRKIKAFLLDNSLGDGAKFLGLDGYNGYYFAIDDDLIPPRHHVNYLKSKINYYNGLVSILGKVYGNRPIRSFMGGHTEIFRALGTVKEDHHVDLVGSGACGFHTRYFRPDITKWERRNMADIWLSRDAFNQNVPLIVLAHKNSYFKYTLTKNAWRIWGNDRDNKYQTKILNSFLK